MAITSFGYLHGPQPDARACYDLRHQFRDPHLRPELRYLTARDTAVREVVMATDGVLALVHAIAATMDAYLAGPRQDEPLTVALGGAGGRHRSVTAADALAAVWQRRDRRRVPGRRPGRAVQGARLGRRPPPPRPRQGRRRPLSITRPRTTRRRSPVTTEPEHTAPDPDLTVPLSAPDAQALGDDVGQLAVRLGAVLHGLAQLRAGGASTDDLANTILMSNGLMKRLEGVRDAAVRQHAARGGSYGALASAMGVTRATAQSRRDTLLKKDLSEMEKWAVGGD
ncbi:RNase adapter RapZ [Streptomyces sp. SID10815]|uniref:RapZ C-terminal domain-containing protein n=1 Tax=Streptomyces sp. SID10815 TaxID=2706027 RepID=UPI0031BBA05E